MLLADMGRVPGKGIPQGKGAGKQWQGTGAWPSRGASHSFPKSHLSNTYRISCVFGRFWVYPFAMRFEGRITDRSFIYQDYRGNLRNGLGGTRTLNQRLKRVVFYRVNLTVAATALTLQPREWRKIWQYIKPQGSGRT